MDQKSIEALATTILKLHNLSYLDISSNKMSTSDLANFLNLLYQRNQLRSLNIGYNQTGSQKQTEKSELFIETLCKFMHYSDTLLHLNLSGMEFSYESIIKVITNGLRKSRTILSCHLGGLMKQHNKLDEMNKLLKI